MPLSHPLPRGPRPACGRDGLPGSPDVSWERGHLARTGPKARKAPIGATHLSHPLPHPSHGPGSPGSAGILPAPGRRPARRRQERHARATHSPARGPAPGVMSWERGHLARTGPKARKAPIGATHLSHPLPHPRHGPGSGVLGAGHLARNGPKARKAPTEATHLSHPLPRPSHGSWERCPGSAGILPAPGRRPAKRRQERPTRATHSPARATAPGAMSWERGHLARTGPKARKAPTGATHLSHPLPRPRPGPGSDGGLPEAQASRPLDVAGLRPACGRDARAPRDGARASLADSAPQGHSKLSARRLMGPCREQVHGLRQGTSLWPVTRFSPGERESDCASTIRGNQMNLGGPAPA